MTLLLLALVLQAAPTLQRRDTPAPMPSPELTAPGRDTLPAGAEGEYRWRELGEVIQLYIENHHLRGYLTERSDRGHARSAPLTFTFASASARGEQVQFTTRELHGTTYAFTGHLIQDLRPSHQEGAWILEGTLTAQGSAPLHISASLAPTR